MKYTNVHWNLKSPFFTKFRKHYCPDCATRLQTVKLSKIVRAGSAEAREFDLHITGGPHLIGNVKVIWWEFECPNCNRRITIDKMKRMEGS